VYSSGCRLTTWMIYLQSLWDHEDEALLKGMLLFRSCALSRYSSAWHMLTYVSAHRLLLGSISNFLVHNSSVPVMVVRAPKKPKNKKKARRGRAMDQTRSVREANLKYEQAFGIDD